MRALLAALGFLTRLPVPRPELGEGELARAVRLYPLAGLAVGAAVAAAGWAGAQRDAWAGALAAVVAWAWVTGALHLDGLGDLADGLGAAHRGRERLLAAMADPHAGAFAVVAVVLQLLAKLVLVRLLLPAGWPLLLLAPAAARIGPLAWGRALPPLRSGGMGAAIAGAARRRDVAGWCALGLLAGLWVPALLAAPALVAGYGWWLRRRLGGITGDAHGAGIELVETGLLVVAVAIRG